MQFVHIMAEQYIISTNQQHHNSGHTSCVQVHQHQIYKKTNVQATVLMATSAGFPGLATVVVPEVWNSVAIFNSSSTFKRLFSQKYCTPNTDIFYCHMQNTPN